MTINYLDLGLHPPVSAPAKTPFTSTRMIKMSYFRFRLSNEIHRNITKRAIPQCKLLNKYFGTY